MKTRTIILCMLGMSILTNGGLLAQDNSEQVIEKMKALSWFEGDWEGEAWYIGPDQKKNFLTQHEHVVYKLDGAIMTVDGTGKALKEGSDEMEIVFKAFGIFTWDMTESKYAIRAYREGNLVDSELRPNDDGSYSWFIEIPYGKVRYTLRLTEDGTYNEVGEFSRDGGENWMQTFEMTLQKL